MKKERKPSHAELPLAFEIDPEPATATWTARGGIPLVVHTLRSLGLTASVSRNVRIKQRERGFDEVTMVESFVILNAAGGDCLDDFGHLREDQGLAELIGYELPSPAAARKFLSACARRAADRAGAAGAIARRGGLHTGRERAFAGTG